MRQKILRRGTREKCLQCFFNEISVNARMPPRIQKIQIPSQVTNVTHRLYHVSPRAPFNKDSFTKSIACHRGQILRFISTQEYDANDQELQFDSSKTSSQQTEDRDRITNSLLNIKENEPGFMTTDLILDAENALLSWANENSAKGFYRSKDLLERLVKEQETQAVKWDDDDDYSVRPFLVNRVVDCWRICWCAGTVDMEPPAMLVFLEELDVTPQNRALTMTIDAMLRRGNSFEAPLMAQWILDAQMQEGERDPSLRPDSFLMTSVIRAWAKSGRSEGPEMAEAILDLMHEMYDKGWEDSSPNLVTYTSTMEAWSRSYRPEAAESIDRLLDRMKESPLEGLEPDSFVYKIVIDAWCDTRDTFGADKALQRLDEMVQVWNGENDNVSPVSYNFSRVMFALADTGKTKQAEQLYHRLLMYYKESQDSRLQPDLNCKKALLRAYSNRQGSRHAKILLDEMIEDALNGENPMPPRSYFIDVLVGLTKNSNTLTAATQSEKLLRQMVHLASNGYPQLMPDSLSFFKVSKAWAKSQDRAAVTKVAALVHLLDDLYEKTGSAALKPNAKLLETALLTLCHARHPDAPARAEAILSRMENEYAEGDVSMRPTRAGYTNVMQVWVRNDQSNHYAVQKIFDKLKILYSQGHKDYRPDFLVYSTLMASLAQQGDHGRVQAIFEAMCDDYNRGNTEAKPDMHAFNMILKAWSFSDSPSRGARAETFLKRIDEIKKMTGVELKPDAFTYLHLIRIWSNSEAENNAERSENYLRAMIDRSFKPSFSFYCDVIRVWLAKGTEVGTKRASLLLEDLLQVTKQNKIQGLRPKLYREFLQMIADSSIRGRNTQAANLLRNLRKGKVHQTLMPSMKYKSKAVTK